MTLPARPKNISLELAEALDATRAILLDESMRTKTKIQALWAACKLAREFDEYDAVKAAFINLAIETNLINRNGYWTDDDVRQSVRSFGRKDVEHVITWALRGWNPFEKGPLK